MEIERKFLIAQLPGALAGAPSTKIEQGYLVVSEDGSEARLRRRSGTCTLTVKTGRGLSRGEAEIELSGEQFETLWPATGDRRLLKTRYVLDAGDGLTIEVDVYAGAHEGLVVAEVEFPSEEEAAAFAPPAWFDTDVTDDDAYKNRRLATDGLP